MATTALIFDDDHFSMGFLQVVLSDLGLGLRAFSDAHDAMELIRKDPPAVVFLDTMVQGAEGLSLCSEIKADPALSNVKVVVVSGKVYWDDKARASWAKADLYVHKPIEPEQLYIDLREIVPGLREPDIEPLRQLPSPEATEGRPAHAPHPSATEEEKKAEAAARPWNLTFWGTGQDADCVGLADLDRLLVFDAGAGLEHLVTGTPPGVREVWILLSHYHKGHVAGLAHAKRWVDAGYKLHIVGPAESEHMLEKLVQRVLPGVEVDVQPAWAGEFEKIPDLRVSLMYTMHPGPCFAFRVSSAARSVVIAADDELPPDVPAHMERMARFAYGADLLVHDARYMDEDYLVHTRRGHCTPLYAMELALRADVRALAFCHVDPQYGIPRRARMLAHLEAHYEPGMKLERCHLAHPGLSIPI